VHDDLKEHRVNASTVQCQLRRIHPEYARGVQLHCTVTSCRSKFEALIFIDGQARALEYLNEIIARKVKVVVVPVTSLN